MTAADPDRPRLVLLHGFTCTPGVWEGTRAALAGVAGPVAPRMPEAGRDRLWASIRTMDASGWLDGLRLPVLGVYGGRGRFGADEGGRLAGLLHLDRIPGARVAIAPAAGHFVMWDDPATLHGS